jgi:hypothetical protein
MRRTVQRLLLLPEGSSEIQELRRLMDQHRFILCLDRDLGRLRHLEGRRWIPAYQGNDEL